MAKEYIEREALLREFGEEPYVWHDDDAEEMQERNDWNTYTNIVKAAPAADVAEVVHGRWIQGNGYVECSECNTIGSPHWKCCPVCTARMDFEG